MTIDNYLKRRRTDYNGGYVDGTRDGVRKAVEFMMYSMIQYLGDKRGWKRERLFEAVKWIAQHAIMISEDLTTFPEVVQAVHDKYGIIIDDGKIIMLEES